MSGVRSKTFDQRVTSETLPPLCSVMAVSYALMAVAHAWLLPAGTARIVMIISAVATSIIAFFVGRWLQVAQSFEKHATLVVLSLFGLALVNCGLHMYLFEDPGQTPLFALVIVAAGFFIASFTTLAISLVAIMAVWWLLFASLGDFTDSVNYVFLISIACAVSLTVNLARTRNLHRLEVERERAARQIEMIGQDRRLYLQRVLQAMEPGLCTVDADGYISLVNAAFAALLNGTPESITGMTIHAATKATPLEGRLGTRLRESVEVPLGNGRTVRLSETRLPSENGVQSGRLVIAIDVSSQKHLEEERVKLLRSVQETQRLAALGTASSRMAHDFNNHLAIISGSLEMLSVQLPNNTYVTGAMDATHAAAAATRQLQAMAADRQHVFEAVPVNRLLTELLTVLEASAPHGISFELRLDDTDGVVNVDKQQLEQAIFNVAMNAAESYGGDEGLVMITAARRSAGAEPLMEIRISDEGSGIDPRTLDDLYTPFNTTKGPGRGLGLPATNEIVQQHGGTMDIRSAPGAGTTVAMLIPAVSGVSSAG